MSLKKTINRSFDDIVHDLRVENDVLKKEVHFLKNRMMEQRGSGGTPTQEKIINEMFQ